MILEFLFILTWGFGDLISTYFCYKKYGEEGETNPIGKFLLKKYGFGSLIIIKITSIIFIFYIVKVDSIYDTFIIIFGIIFGLYLTINNTTIYLNNKSVWRYI